MSDGNEVRYRYLHRMKTGVLSSLTRTLVGFGNGGCYFRFETNYVDCRNVLFRSFKSVRLEARWVTTGTQGQGYLSSPKASAGSIRTTGQVDVKASPGALGALP